MREIVRPPTRSSLSCVSLSLVLAVVLFAPGPLDAQVLERLGNAAKHEAEAEANRQVRGAVRTAIRCAIGDRVCREKAEREGREVILVDENGNPVSGAAGSAYWHLTFGGRQWEGGDGRVIDDEILFTLHLVEDDDVAFYLFLAGDDEGERAADAVVLAFGDGVRCRYPFDGAPQFTVRLDRVDSEWVVGSYDGALRCVDGPALTPTRGTFRLARSR